MTHLNIQQGLNIEVVSTNLIKKLYEAALSVPEPLEGELDAAYMSGNLLVDKSYRALVEYLTNRFDDLHINVTGGYYIPFHDSAVNDVLKNTIGDGVGVLDTLFSAVTNLNDLGLVNNTDITDFREGCLLTNSNIGTSGGFTNGCSNLDVLGIPPNFSHYTPSITFNCRPSKLVISDWGKWIATTFANGQSFCDSKHDMCTLNSDNSLTVVKNVTLPEGSNFHNGRYMCGSFFNSTVEEVTLPTTVTRLADFQRSDITTLNFPLNSSLTTIILYCFYGCNKLTLDVSDLPLSITTIEQLAFVNCSNITGSLNLPNLVSLGSTAFANTNITSIVDLGSVTSIPDGCFKGCNISSINQSVVDLITSWGWLSLYVSGNAASTIKPGPNTKRLLPSIIGVNNPNGVVYLPLITRSLQHSNNLVDGDCHCPFNYRYNSGVARNIYGLIYMPNLSLIESGYGTFPYQNGLAIDTTADLFYIKSVSTLTPGTFSECNISHIIINNTTPPNLVDTQGLQNETGGLKKCIFSYNGSLSGIYVPDSAVNSYKTAWGDVLAVTPVNNNGVYLSENVIKPISSLNGGIIYATENDWISDERPSALIAEYMGLNTADLATFVSANNLTYYVAPSS